MSEQDQSKPRFINARRRDFLQSAAVAGGAAVTGVAIADEQGPADDLNADEKENPSRNGYQLTDHVRAYYAKARF